MILNLHIPIDKKVIISLTNVAGEISFLLFLFAFYYQIIIELFIPIPFYFTTSFLIISILFFAIRYYLKPNSFCFPKIFIWLLFFLILLDFSYIAGLFYTGSTDYGYYKTFRFIIYTNWAFCGSVLCITNHTSLKRFAWAGIICALCMAVFVLMSYPGVGVIRSIFVLGTNYIGLSRICGFGLLSILVFFLPIEPNPWRRKTFWFLTLILILAMMISGSRGPLIAIIVSLILFFVLSIRKIYPSLIIERFALFLGFICLFTGVIGSFIGKTHFTTLFYRVEKVLDNADNSASTRVSFFESALNQWINSPIWGGGPGQFGVTLTGEEIERYPHNIFLEIASENGLFGLIPFCAILGITIRNGLSYVYSDDKSAKNVARFLLVMFCYTLVNAMISGDINDNSLFFAIIGLLGVINHFENDDY